MEGKHILEVRNLNVVYQTELDTVYAVNDLSFSLNSGETLGLVGETGAGKTTTALSIMRLLPEKVGIIKSGSIILDDLDIIKAREGDMLSIRGNLVSMIFQDPMTALNPTLTVGKQVEEVLMLHDRTLNRGKLSKATDELLDLVGIQPSRKNEYPHQFSGGMKQRIIIAIALACKPKLLIADEPTTALDVTIQAQVLEMMIELKEKLGTAMLLITHDLGVVAQICDNVAIMYAGEIIEYGNVEAIFGGLRHHPYTDGLFGSIPSMSSNSKRLHPIDGLMPDPSNLPDGCRFHDRCPKCAEKCKVTPPGTAQVDGLSVRCHLYSDTKLKSDVGEAAFATRSDGVFRHTSSKGSKNNEAYV